MCCISLIRDEIFNYDVLYSFGEHPMIRLNALLKSCGYLFPAHPMIQGIDMLGSANDTEAWPRRIGIIK